MASRILTSLKNTLPAAATVGFGFVGVSVGCDSSAGSSAKLKGTISDHGNDKLREAALHGRLDATEKSLAQMSLKFEKALAAGKRAAFVADVLNQLTSAEGTATEASLVAECSRLLPLAVGACFEFPEEDSSFGSQIVSRLCYRLYSVSGMPPSSFAWLRRGPSELRRNLRLLHEAQQALHAGDLQLAFGFIESLSGPAAQMFEEWLELADQTYLIRTNLTAVNTTAIQELDSLSSEPEK